MAWELLAFDGFDEIGDVGRLEFLHGLDELLLLDFPEDGDVLGKFLQSLGELGAALGEGVPVDVGLLSGELENVVKMRLDILDF